MGEISLSRIRIAYRARSRPQIFNAHHRAIQPFNNEISQKKKFLENGTQQSHYQAQISEN